MDIGNLFSCATSKIYLFEAEKSYCASGSFLGIYLLQCSQLFMLASQHSATSSTVPDIPQELINLKVQALSEHSISGPLLYI